MLLCLPRRYRSEDEDYAPRDYSFVGSVAEGARRQQAEPIHKDAESATVRHRADPAARDGVTAAQPPVAEGPRGYDAARRLPRIADGPAPAASVAYPRPRDNGFTKSPTYAPQAPMPLPMAEAQTHPEGFAYEQPSRRDGRYAQAQGNRLDEPQQQTRDRWMQEPDPVGVPQPGANEQTAQEEARNALRRGFDRNAAPQAYDNAAVCEPERVLQPQRSGRAAVQPGDVFAPDGSQYARLPRGNTRLAAGCAAEQHAV